MVETTYPILDTINNPADVRKLAANRLADLATDVRNKTIHTVAQTGGHLGAGLGVVELTVALHYVFDTPKDKLIWDVGHQAYPHKILTERKDKIGTLRQAGGLSGFTKRNESPYDPFGAGHSSTSISAALGMSIARDLKGEEFETIAVIGDGAMSAGMAFEAMNHAGDLSSRLIVILNDNKMSIAPAVGAMSKYLSRLISSKPYLTFRSMAKNIASHLPEPLEKAAKKAEQYTKDFCTGGNFFEQMGFYYVGPIDGHDLNQLIPILQNIKQDKSIKHPILLHVVTEKGHGYTMPEAKNEKLHAVRKFDVKTATQAKPSHNKKTYTQIFSDALIEQATTDESIIAITAAMPSGTGLDKFSQSFPDRMFDVGIAEQHAVTFAAGMSCEGFKPFCAIYSTFLQRAYDQIIHDVAIQKLPVRFAIDRADLVGADGPTHSGAFDMTFLSTLPNFIIMAASNSTELRNMVATAAAIDDRPCAFRYPRGESSELIMPEIPIVLDIGKGRVITEGQRVAILSCGARLDEAIKASHLLEPYGITPTIADARFIKPLDTALIDQLIQHHELIITIEGGSIGGFGSHVLEYVSNHPSAPPSLKIHCLHLPDRFIDQNTPEAMYEEAGLSAANICQIIIQKLKLDTKISILDPAI